MSNIYTCTLNLALDLFIETEDLEPFIVNRTIDDDIQANGKGVNVSLVLKMLGLDSMAIGFKAGFIGQYIEDYLYEKNIQSEFLDVPGLTRINVFTKVNNTKEEFKLVNKGPVIPREQIKQLLEQIKQFEKGDFLCVSGSLPQGVSPQVLIDIAEICYDKGVYLVIDSSYKEILDCLKYKPFLLKPNEEELSTWFDKTIETEEEYIFYGKKLLEMGAQSVLLSMGGDGAYYFSEKVVLYGNSPKGDVINTACAGDTLLASFLGGVIQKKELPFTLKRSLAAGSSTAFKQGLTDFSDVDELSRNINIKEIKS